MCVIIMLCFNCVCFNFCVSIKSVNIRENVNLKQAYLTGCFVNYRVNIRRSISSIFLSIICKRNTQYQLNVIFSSYQQDNRFVWSYIVGIIYITSVYNISINCCHRYIYWPLVNFSILHLLIL